MLLRLHAHSQPGVVLILGCQPWQKELLCREVKRHDPSIEPPVEINNEVKSRGKTPSPIEVLVP